MNISIHKPFSISEIGKRLNNEDHIYPSIENENADNKLFLVCDGVGGSNKGEVASALACDSIQTYFQTFVEPDKEFDADFIEKAVRYAEIRFDEHINENPSSRGMATTLCLLYIADEGIFVTHAGDSRIYQFRNGEIIYKTEDHSLVNSMLKSGQINAEDAEKHPQKNVIYRAIQGSEKPIEIDVTHLIDIQPEDSFLLCTDGILETFKDHELSNLFSENLNTEERLIKIRNNCRKNSRDNYSAYIISIQEIEKVNVFKQVMTSFLYAFV